MMELKAKWHIWWNQIWIYVALNNFYERELAWYNHNSLGNDKGIYLMASSYGGDYFNDVTLLWASRFDYSHNWMLKKHSHDDFYQLIYCISGDSDVIVGPDTYRFVPSSLVFIKPDAEHSIDNVGRNGLKTLDLKFFINNKVLQEKMEAMPSFFEYSDESIRDILEEIRMEGDEEDYEYIAYSNLLLSQLLIRLLRQNMPLKKKPIASKNFYYRENLSPVVVKVIAFTENNYKENLKADDYEKHLNYSYRFLSKLSKTEIGFTPVELLEQQRIKIAKEKLILTGEEIKTISDMVGFPNIHHFSRSFKRVVGIPPGEYRKISREGIRKDIIFSKNFKNELNIEKK